MSPGALCGSNLTLNVSIYPDSWCGCWRSSSSTSRGLPPLPPPPPGLAFSSGVILVAMATGGPGPQRTGHRINGSAG